jgi:hypothetical protein
MSAAALEQLGVTEEEYVRYITQNVDGRRVRVIRPSSENTELSLVASCLFDTAPLRLYPHFVSNWASRLQFDMSI